MHLKSGSQPVYWARHFACALDVFELLTAGFQHGQITSEGAAMSSGSSSRLMFNSIKNTLFVLTSQEHWPGEQCIYAPTSNVRIYWTHIRRQQLVSLYF